MYCSCQREKGGGKQGSPVGAQGNETHLTKKVGRKGEGRENEKNVMVGLQTGSDSAEEHLN